jgi:hypothetical protein
VSVHEGLEITLHYGGEPVLYPGVARVFRVSLRLGRKPVEKTIALEVPPKWTVKPAASTAEPPAGGAGGAAFQVMAEEPQPLNDIEVLVRHGTGSHRARFRVLGPQEARGYPATQNVPTCPKCWGMQGYCICTRQ